MKRVLSILLAVVVVSSMLLLTACTNEKATVESVLNIDSEYNGSRKITIKFPLDTHIDSLSEQLIDNNPLKESKTSSFEYLGVEKDGYVFVINVSFDDRESYLSQMSSLVGREVVSDMSQPESVMCSGTRMREDFDVSDIIKWMTDLTQNNEDTKDVVFDYSVNTVSINGTVFNTESTIDISEREGKAINSISIETTNLKDETYDRTITFLIPNKTYNDLAGSIEPYFASLTSEQAHYSDWTSLGESWEYKVIFKSLSIDELSQCTAMLLDTKEDTLYYEDKNKASTPLSEGLVFEESFNTFSFVNSKGEDVELTYKYALPTKTTHSDGNVFIDGKWSATGSWQDGVYSTEVDTDIVKVRIPDGIQYAINGIRMDLEVLGEDDFVRTVEFLYSKTQGMDGMLYAQNFFKSKGVLVETDEDDDNLMCRVISKGSSSQITDELVELFGSGNFMTHTTKDTALSLSQKTQLTDYVNLSYMLNSTNANRPITYTVRSSGDENIIDLKCDGEDSDRDKGNSDVLLVEVSRGQGTVTYNGNIPKMGSIIVYCLVGLFMFGATVVVILYMLKKQKERKAQVPEKPAYSLSQTTTFSIAELKGASGKPNADKSDEIVVSQINKEIEDKIEADRIESLSKELKAKEIAELEKKIYGTSNDETIEEDQKES